MNGKVPLERSHSFESRSIILPYKYFQLTMERLRQKAKENPAVSYGVYGGMATAVLGLAYATFFKRKHPSLQMYMIHLRLAACGIVVGGLVFTAVQQSITDESSSSNSK